MGDRLEAQLSVIENIQEEFGHDIREVKEHLARVTSLFEDYIKTQAVHPQGPSPNQQVSPPFARTTSYFPHGTDRPNLRQPVPPLRLLSCQLSDLSISQTTQGTNQTDKRLTRTIPDGIPSPLATSNYSQS